MYILVTFLESFVPTFSDTRPDRKEVGLGQPTMAVQVNAALLVTTVALTSRSVGNKRRRQLSIGDRWIMLLTLISVFAGFSLRAHTFAVDSFATHSTPLKPRVASFPRTSLFSVRALDDVQTKHGNGAQQQASSTTKLLIHWKYVSC